MKSLVIYHADCTDGYGAAFAAWMKLGDGAEYLPMHYADTSPDMMAEKCRGREVHILDFSFQRLVMEHIFSAAKRVVWLDHHKTAFEMAEVTPGVYRVESSSWPLGSKTDAHKVVLDSSKSGALLAWEYFHPGAEVPMLIQHIDDRDRWQFKLDGSRELHAALASYKPWNFDLWDCAFLRCGNGYNYIPEELFEIGKAILRAQDQHVKSMAKQARKCEIVYHIPYGPPGTVDIYCDGPEPLHYPGLAVNASLHQSEVGHALANQSGTYGLVWYLGADNKVRCSLRSNGDYDVSAIAKSFGGGGHLNAAGFETDINTLIGWLK